MLSADNSSAAFRPQLQGSRWPRQALLTGPLAEGGALSRARCPGLSPAPPPTTQQHPHPVCFGKNTGKLCFDSQVDTGTSTCGLTKTKFLPFPASESSLKQQQQNRHRPPPGPQSLQGPRSLSPRPASRVTRPSARLCHVGSPRLCPAPLQS